MLDGQQHASLGLGRRPRLIQVEELVAAGNDGGEDRHPDDQVSNVVQQVEVQLLLGVPGVVRQRLQRNLLVAVGAGVLLADDAPPADALLVEFVLAVQLMNLFVIHHARPHLRLSRLDAEEAPADGTDVVPQLFVGEAILDVELLVRVAVKCTYPEGGGHAIAAELGEISAQDAGEVSRAKRRRTRSRAHTSER